jgi:hydroxymethylbilane synthase
VKQKWILGTRGSKLALTQAEIVKSQLSALNPSWSFEVRIIKTTGDSIWNTPLYLIGQKGLFVKEIEEALSRGEIDLAVHSMKDLPTELADGLILGTVLEREDPRDTLISAAFDSLGALPDSARIGTSSMRRQSQLLGFNSTFNIVPLRGNVDTRIRKLREQELDAIVLAWAGVKRMGFVDQVKEILPLEVMVPASGQGAIGIETRDEEEALNLLRPLNHTASAFEVDTERRIQRSLGGGCSVPFGVNVSLSGDEVTIYAAYAVGQDSRLMRHKVIGAKNDEERLIADILKLLAL